MRKKVLPVAIVLILIVLIGVAGVAVHLIHKYTPTEDRMDAYSYYDTTDGAGLPLVFGKELLETRGLLEGSDVYLPINVVTDYLNKRFYWDGNENILIYTTPTEKYIVEPDARDYLVGDDDIGEEDYVVCKLDGDTLYIHIDFVKKFTDIEYQVWEQPDRLVVQYQWGEIAMVEVSKDQAAVRYLGGIKSEILTNVAAGTQLRLIEELEDWDQVVTEDGFIGYIEKKDLADAAYTVVMDRTFTEPEYTSISRDYKINLAWHQVVSEIANDTLEEMMSDVEGVNVISPTWFSIKDNSGSISNLATESYVTRAHEMGLEVWGLVDNFSGDIDTYQVLSHTKSRTTLERNLISQAIRFSLDGINIDFETLAEETGPHFIQFLREMSILCRSNGLILSVDNPPPEPYTSHYDRASQGEVVDYVIIMGYDEHFQGSEEAGSVASLPWVEEGVRNTVSEVPANKVINGIPFYTRIWETSAGVVTSEAVSMGEASAYVKKHKIETYWDQDYSQNYGEYYDGNDLYQIWLEDEDSIAAKMELVGRYELAGVAEWKLGFERPSVWGVISEGLK